MALTVCIVRCDNTDVTVVKVYFSDEGAIDESLPLSITITSWVLLV